MAKKPIKINVTKEEQEIIYHERMYGKNKTLRRRAKILYYASLGKESIQALVDVTNVERKVIVRALKKFDEEGIECLFKIKGREGYSLVLDTIEAELIEDFKNDMPNSFSEAMKRIKETYNISITRVPLTKWLNNRGIFLPSQKIHTQDRPPYEEAAKEMPMPRTARKQSKTGVYHIMLRGNNKQQIFLDDNDNRQFLKILLEYKEKCNYNVYAYCLMGNHLHLLLKINEVPLENVMKRIVTKFVYNYNVKYARVGHLFQGRFKSEPIEDDASLLQVIRYIHLNPVKAGMCAKPENYIFSSYNEYINGKDEISVTDTKFVYGMLSKAKFKEFHKNTNEDTEFIDVLENKKRITEEEALLLLKKVCDEYKIIDLKQCTKQEQFDIVSVLKKKGLSVRQIERLTGISHWIAQKG